MKLISRPLRPNIGKSVFIHPSATVQGRVMLHDYSSIWPGSVLRGDINQIVVGRYSNIQDLSVLHVEDNRGCYVGDYCVVGHRVILHGCTVGDGVLVGMGTIVLNGAKIGSGALLGAGTLVTEGMTIKADSLYFGTPAKYVRKLTKAEIRATIKSAQKYAKVAEAHQAGWIEHA